MKVLGLMLGLLGLGTLVVVMGSSELDRKNRLAVWEDFIKDIDKYDVYYGGKQVDKSKVDFNELNAEDWQCDILENKAYLTHLYTDNINGVLPVIE